MNDKRLATIERYVRSQYPRTAARTPNGLSDTEIIADLLAEVQRLRRMPVPGQRIKRDGEVYEVSLYIENVDDGADSGFCISLPDWLAWAKNAEVVDGDSR